MRRESVRVDRISLGAVLKAVEDSAPRAQGFGFLFLFLFACVFVVVFFGGDFFFGGGGREVFLFGGVLFGGSFFLGGGEPQTGRNSFPGGFLLKPQKNTIWVCLLVGDPGCPFCL